MPSEHPAPLLEPSPPIAAPERYAPADDLWIVLVHYNPAGYRRRQSHYETVRDRLRASGLRVVTVECAFGEQPFALAPSDDVIQLRAPHVLWQKERLLNLAVARLPAACAKVAWIDGDVLFDNPDWAADTSRLLDRVALVQPCSTTIRLPRDLQVYAGEGEVRPSMAAVLQRDPHTARTGIYADHGDTGMVWAARRHVLADGLYDACIAGGGDHLIAHAAAGAWQSPCLGRILGDGGYRTHFMRWAERFHRAVGDQIGVVDGTALHLWHGDAEDRRYVDRHHALLAFGFDPRRDLRPGAGGCWEWASDKPELHAWVAHYFRGRREDGDGQI
jgi:hypothetical protein